MTRPSPKRLYLIPVLSKALDILELLQNERGPLTLEAIYQRTSISKTTVYRILKTFVHRGYLAQSQDGLYRMMARPKKARFGFGGESAEMPFSEAVSDSLRSAAAAAGVDLMVLDNRYDGATAVRNADEFVAAGVDLVIEFQIESTGGTGHRGQDRERGLVDIPHPHATFFGVNNYRVGCEAGACLAAHAEPPVGRQGCLWSTNWSPPPRRASSQGCDCATSVNFLVEIVALVHRWSMMLAARQRQRVKV